VGYVLVKTVYVLRSFEGIGLNLNIGKDLTLNYHVDGYGRTARTSLLVRPTLQTFAMFWGLWLCESHEE